MHAHTWVGRTWASALTLPCVAGATAACTHLLLLFVLNAMCRNATSMIPIHLFVVWSTLQNSSDDTKMTDYRCMSTTKLMLNLIDQRQPQHHVEDVSLPPRRTGNDAFLTTIFDEW